MRGGATFKGGAYSRKLSVSVLPNYPRFSRTTISRSSDPGATQSAVTLRSKGF